MKVIPNPKSLFEYRIEREEKKQAALALVKNYTPDENGKKQLEKLSTEQLEKLIDKSLNSKNRFDSLSEDGKKSFKEIFEAQAYGRHKGDLKLSDIHTMLKKESLTGCLNQKIRDEEAPLERKNIENFRDALLQVKNPVELQVVLNALLRKEEQESTEKAEADNPKEVQPFPKNLDSQALKAYNDKRKDVLLKGGKNKEDERLKEAKGSDNKTVDTVESLDEDEVFGPKFSENTEPTTAYRASFVNFVKGKQGTLLSRVKAFPDNLSSKEIIRAEMLKANADLQAISETSKKKKTLKELEELTKRAESRFTEAMKMLDRFDNGVLNDQIDEQTKTLQKKHQAFMEKVKEIHWSPAELKTLYTREIKKNKARPTEIKEDASKETKEDASKETKKDTHIPKDNLYTPKNDDELLKSIDKNKNKFAKELKALNKLKGKTPKTSEELSLKKKAIDQQLKSINQSIKYLEGTIAFHDKFINDILS